jgi:hypothetical protein
MKHCLSSAAVMFCHITHTKLNILLMAATTAPLTVHQSGILDNGHGAREAGSPLEIEGKPVIAIGILYPDFMVRCGSSGFINPHPPPQLLRLAASRGLNYP